jgi:hypothetical protein
LCGSTSAPGASGSTLRPAWITGHSETGAYRRAATDIAPYRRLQGRFPAHRWPCRRHFPSGRPETSDSKPWPNSVSRRPSSSKT